MLNRQEKPRAPSRFFAQEFLLEYKEGRLSGERKNLVEAVLKTDQTLKEEITKLNAAEDYCKKIGSAVLAQEFKIYLHTEKLPYEKRVDMLRLRNWPDALRWATEAFLLSCMVAIAAVTIPWQIIYDKYQDLAVRPAAFVRNVKKSVPAEVEENKKSSPKEKVEAPLLAAKNIEPKKVETPEPPKAIQVESQAKTVEPATLAAEPKKIATQGVVYQMSMSMNDIREKAAEIRELLTILGAEKAGKVELGWRKTDGNYFHFSMPQENYRQLTKTLGQYGPVRIYKNVHPRVMPEGIIRIILWIEDSSINSEVDESGVGTQDEQHEQSTIAE
jgi:hypothetical protein